MLSQDISVIKFLPDEVDEAMLRQQLVVLVERVLVKHLATFNGSETVDHIPHKFSYESGRKSVVVSSSDFFHIITVFVFKIISFIYMLVA